MPQVCCHAPDTIEPRYTVSYSLKRIIPLQLPHRVLIRGESSDRYIARKDRSGAPSRLCATSSDEIEFYTYIGTCTARFHHYPQLRRFSRNLPTRVPKSPLFADYSDYRKVQVDPRAFSPRRAKFNPHFGRINRRASVLILIKHSAASIITFIRIIARRESRGIVSLVIRAFPGPPVQEARNLPRNGWI